VTRQSGVSHHAMNSQQASSQAVLEPVIAEKSGGDHSC